VKSLAPSPTVNIPSDVRIRWLNTARNSLVSLIVFQTHPLAIWNGGIKSNAQDEQSHSSSMIVQFRL
jgi:hypothetical protein